MPRVLVIPVILVMATIALMGLGTRPALPTATPLAERATTKAACECCTSIDAGSMSACCCCESPTPTEPPPCCCTSHPEQTESFPPAPLPSPAPRIAGLLPAPVWCLAPQTALPRSTGDTRRAHAAPPLRCAERLARIGHRTT